MSINFVITNNMHLLSKKYHSKNVITLKGVRAEEVRKEKIVDWLECPESQNLTENCLYRIMRMRKGKHYTEGSENSELLCMSQVDRQGCQVFIMII